MPRLITDFDGPIVDVSERYYQVYKYCLAQVREPGQTVRQLTKSEFWQLKRSKIPEVQIGLQSGLDADQALTFADLRRATVHTMPYFDLDRPVTGAIAALERLQAEGVDLVVMTMRRTRELNFALEKFDLERFFPLEKRYCLANDYVKTGDTKDKPLLMARAMVELPLVADTWMVGDTEADMVAAQSQNIRTIGVLSGIRDRTQLSKYNPDTVLPDLATAAQFVLTPTFATT